MTKLNRTTHAAVATRTAKPLLAAAAAASSNALANTNRHGAALQSPSAPGRLLVVDDHRQGARIHGRCAGAAGHQVESVASASEAVARLVNESFDCIVTDLQMPGMSGLEFILHLEQRPHGAQIVMVTAHATVASAVEAMRHGAFDYIEKPFDADNLEQLVTRAMQHGRLLDAQSECSAHGCRPAPAMIGSSRRCRRCVPALLQVAPTRGNRADHGRKRHRQGTGRPRHSRRQRSACGTPLVSLNCPVLSAQLMESELFGHERGAFTGAESPRTGRFELADTARFCWTKSPRSIWRCRPSCCACCRKNRSSASAPARLCTSTCACWPRPTANLQAEVAAGRFREDLYYRLAVVPLDVPPLRDRPEDIPELIAHFLFRSAQRLRRNPCDLEPAAVELLCEYPWPGNVRELENIISRASVLNVGGSITADELRGWLSLHGLPCGAGRDSAERHRRQRGYFGTRHGRGIKPGRDGAQTHRGHAGTIWRTSCQGCSSIGNRFANALGQNQAIWLCPSNQAVCESRMKQHEQLIRTTHRAFIAAPSAEFADLRLSTFDSVFTGRTNVITKLHTVRVVNLHCPLNLEFDRSISHNAFGAIAAPRRTACIGLI